MKQSKFHGSYSDSPHRCERPGCPEQGQFRAPGVRRHSFDGPGQWRWFCLTHIREFNAGYDWFEGMSADEIADAQSPASGWRTESPSFAATGADATPRWADFDDPLEAIAARARGMKADFARPARADSHFPSSRFSRAERDALDIMGLGSDVDRAKLRRRYGDLLRRYHPDRNGGNRSYEQRLAQVVEAYQTLRKSTVFAQ